MSLVPRLVYGSLDLTAAPYSLMFGRDFGAAEISSEALPLLLQDGEIEVSPRAGNRDMTFQVAIEGDLLSMAQAEAALALEADKPRNTLRLEPGEETAPAAVYETFRAEMTQEFLDEAEQNGYRVWTIALRAQPFARSATLVTSTGAGGGGTPPPTPETVTINAGSSITRWSASSGNLASSGSTLRVSNSARPEWKYVSATAVPLSSTTYVTIVARLVVASGIGSSTPATMSSPPSLEIDGQRAEFVAAVGASGVYSRFYYKAPAATGLSFEFKATIPIGSYVEFYELARTNQTPISGTQRQKQRSILVSGSARTSGSLALEHASSGLGSALVYTWPQPLSPGYSPPLRPRRASGGGTTIDSSLASGARENLDTIANFDIPTSDLIEGTHLLMARLRSNTAGDQTVNWASIVRQGGVDVGPLLSGSRVIPFGSSPTAWRNVVLARVSLPNIAIASNNTTAVVRIAIGAASPPASDIDLDEAWLFNTTVGDLTWVETGASNRLWLDTATVDRPRPVILRGTAADRSDGVYPGADVVAFGAHKFQPPAMNVFTVTSGALDAAVSLTHYPRFIGHPTS